MSKATGGGTGQTLISHDHLFAFLSPASQQSAVVVPGSAAMPQSDVLVESGMLCRKLSAAASKPWGTTGGLLLPFAKQKLLVPDSIVSSLASCNASMDVAYCYWNWAAGAELKDSSAKNKKKLGFFFLFPIALCLMRREDAAGAKTTTAALGALVLLLFLPLCCHIFPAAYTAGPCALLGNSLTHIWGWS